MSAVWSMSTARVAWAAANRTAEATDAASARAGRLNPTAISTATSKTEGRSLAESDANDRGDRKVPSFLRAFLHCRDMGRSPFRPRALIGAARVAATHNRSGQALCEAAQQPVQPVPGFSFQ